jgi:exopolysaccharide biosynthesis polyprenyl glycosylphosphotransferase
MTGLAGMDGVALAAAFALAYFIRFRASLPLLEPLPERVGFYAWVAVGAVPVWLGVFALYRLYDRDTLFAGFDEYSRIVNACTAGTIAVVVFSFVDTTLVISRGWLLLTWLLAITLGSVGRFAARRVLRQVHARGYLLSPAVIVGTNEEGTALAEQLCADPASGLRVLGFVGSAPLPRVPRLAGLPVLGDIDELRAIVRQHGAREILVASSALERKDLLELYQTFAEDEAIHVRLSSGLFEILTTGVQIHEISFVPLMTPQRVRITSLDAVLKAALDYLGAGLGLIVLGPLLLALALAVRWDSPGPAFHRRRVLGRGGKPFAAYKFRTMLVDADQVLAANPVLREAFERGYKLKDDPRVTRLGRFLRRTSLDELPQLLNVLRGEMSLVGPRMIAPDEAPRYGKWRLNLLTVKPGITGPWQVKGRSDLPYEERVRLSMHYVRNYSLWLDLAILVETVAVVVRGRGAY